jgi:ATP-dependent helicase/nuclease subunit B
MRRAVQYLLRFCSEHRLEKKYLIVPSYQVGHQIGEALAKGGGSWVNLHFVTMPALAQEIAGADLSRRRIRFISSTGSFFLVEKIFRKLKDEAGFDYFGKIEATTGIIRALQNSIYALRMAGLKNSDLKPSGFIDNRKGEEVIRLLRSYEEELDKGSLIDLPGLYELALQQIGARRREQEAGKKQKEERELYLTFRDRPHEYLEREFFKKMAGENLILIPQDAVYGLVRPRRMWEVVSEPQAPPAVPSPTPPASNIERLPWLFATTKAPPPFRDNTIDIFSAIGPTNECREILRRIVTEKIPLDDVEIIHPPGPTYPSIMYALAAKSGLPMTFAEGIPLAFTAPGKVFSGLVEWLEHNYLVSDLCALIEAGALKLPSGNGHVALTPLKASRYLKSAMIGCGRERYVTRLQTLIQDADESVRAAEVEGEFEKIDKYRENIREVESLVALIKDILDLLPGEDEEGRIDFGELCRGAASFVGKFAAIYGDLDAEARGLLRSRLDEAAAFKTAPLKRQAAFEWLKNLAAGLRVGALGPAPGHLHLSGWRMGGFSGRPVTFVVGLDQGTFPGAGIQDPILLDEERERISTGLRTSADSLRENLWAMAGMLAGLRGRVVLSYSSYDIIEERQSFSSSLILQAARLREGKPDLDYSALGKLIPEARGFLPEGEEEAGAAKEGKAKAEVKGSQKRAAREPRALDETDWWLGKLAPGGVLRDGMEAVKRNFDLLGRGIFGLERREREAVGEFEGRIKIDPKEVHPLHNKDIVLSASRLEKLAKCPFGYLMRYVLDVRPPDELELDQSQWLNPLLRGTLLHDIFAGFMRELTKERQKGKGAERAKAKARGEKGPVVRALEHGPLMRRITDEVIERYREEIPPPSEGVFEQERREIEEAAAVFLKAEEERQSAGEPLLFEVSFGTGRGSGKGGGRKGEGEGPEAEDESEGAEAGEERMEEPAVLDLGSGRSVSIAGRIDRIDRLEDGRYRVIDYKTGSYKIYDDLDMFGKGRILQHALYAVAAEQILRKLGIDERPVIAESGYYFPTRKGEGNWVQPKLDRQIFNKLVMELIGIIERGHFVANPGLGDIDCEEFCDYGRICGGSAARERAKEKKEHNKDVFDIFERLKEYE